MNAVLHLLVRPRAWMLVVVLSAVGLIGVSGSAGGDAHVATGQATLVVFPGFQGEVELEPPGHDASGSDVSTCVFSGDEEGKDGCRHHVFGRASMSS